MAGDGCTLWIDGVWRACCDAHDLAYASGVDKALADVLLRDCVSATGFPLMGWIMFLGVTLFGGFFYARHRRKNSKS